MAVGTTIYTMPHFGWQIDGIRSGSMAPTIERVALVIWRSVDPKTVRLGDIIVCHPVAIGENLVCHRVIGIDNNTSLKFQTKGDAQDAPDPFAVPAQNVVGKVLCQVSLLGYATIFIKSLAGFLLSLVIPGVAISLICLGDIRTELARRKRKASLNEQTI